MRLDRRIAPLVDALNQMPGVETNGSCQGHLDDRLPYVSFVCDEKSLWPILRGANMLNLTEPQQVRAYVEVLAYGNGRLYAVLRFHHLFLKVKPTRRTVAEWHRRIHQMTKLILAETRTGELSGSDMRRAFS
jgi:hypothetical protein